MNSKKNPKRISGRTVALKAPARKGYLFRGWYTGSNYKTRVTKLTAGRTKSITLYARWSRVTTGKTAVISAKNLKGRMARIKYRRTAGASGYRIYYSLKKSMKGARSVYARSTSVTLKKLKKNRTYYIKVRAYRKDSTGRKVYGRYSSARGLKIRK